MDTRILLSVRNANKTGSDARFKTLEVVAWSMTALRSFGAIMQGKL